VHLHQHEVVKQLPGLEALHEQFKEKGIDEIYCLSVNDSFIMNAWAKDLGIEKIKMIPDGNGEFTRDMDMLVFKPAQNFGFRSWRYAMVINDMEIENMFIEDGKNQMGLDDDPYEVTIPENILRNIT
jgi:peroxiredoxin